jgi:hypothetical protein
MEKKIYPEHEKLDKVKDQSEICGEFLDWLRIEKNLALCKYHQRTNSTIAEYRETNA